MSAPHATHEAKLLALTALAGGQLSEVASSRLSRHLDRCAVCRDTLRGMRIHQTLVRQLHVSKPDVDFARMELVLHAEARAVVRRQRGARLAWAAGALAAVAAGVILMFASRSPNAPAEPQSQPSTQPAPLAAGTRPAQTATALSAAVIALRGHASVEHAGASQQAIDMARVLVEGERVVLARDSELHLRFSDQTGVVVGASSNVLLQRLRQGDIELELTSGSVTSRVKHLGADERYEVHAAGYTVAVRGTLFVVSVAGGQVSVQVEEGRVAVTDSQGRLVGDVSAPGTFSSAPGAAGKVAERLVEPRLASLPLSAWPILQLPAWRAVQTWQVDGSRFAASGELATRVPQGNVRLIAELGDGRRRELTLEVPGPGLRVSEDLLRKLLRPDGEDGRAPAALEPAAILGVVHRALPNLQRCYEHSLKQRPDIIGRLTLRISVDGAGRVQRAVPRSDAGGMPDELVDCIRSEAQRWYFPAPGGEGITFDAPIRLAHHQ